MEKEKTKEEKPETLPAEVRANMLSTEKSIFFNVALFEQAQRVAKLFADSTMVPTQFRGNIGNCMIALNYALRIQADAFMVFQCLYEVHGRPGIEGKLVEAIINASNKYSEPLQYEWLDPEDKIVARHIVLNHKEFKAFGCQAFSIDAKSKQRVDGPKITWELIKAKGWYDRKGPDGTLESNNWRAMPEMMFYYRAASWFGNKNCPELKLGMHTVEELEDIVELRQGQNGAYGTPDAVAASTRRSNSQPHRMSKNRIYEAQELKPEAEKKTDPKPEKKKRTKKTPPVEESPETEDKPDLGPTEDQEKLLELVKGAEVAQILNEPAIVVNCPNKEHKPTVKWCNSGNCKVREGCDTWKKYDAWKTA